MRAGREDETAAPVVSHNVLARFASLIFLSEGIIQHIEGDRKRIAARESCHRRVRIISSADLEAAQINHEICPRHL